MTNDERIAALTARLLPAGTPMSDVPADHKGLRVREWIDLQWLRWIAEAATKIETDHALLPLATHRDNYGWRSLPSGSRVLDRG